jgi:hypothetical protein
MDILAPLAGTYIYLSYPWNGKTFIITHNIFLHLYSVWTFFSLLNAVSEKGLHFEQSYYMSDPWINRLIFHFYLSKYYEYLDTFIIYAKGKTPIFLQKYHHIGAALCWHLGWAHKVDSIVYASLANSFIHSIMYLYYLLTFVKVDTRLIKPYITYLQMVQFLSGFTSIYYWLPIETFQNQVIILIFLFYNFGLLLLFGKFIKDTYI